MKGYSIIYCDPPWFYNPRRNPKGTKFGGGASAQYPVMKTDEICKLPVARITAKNCALFLWTTMPRLPDALKVIEAWEFKYRTVGFSWIKINKSNKKPFFGPGYYTASNAELCLLAVKGRMKPVSNYVSQVIIQPKGKHSAKPEAARERIVELFGDLDRIELFARSESPGWDAWGLDVDTVGFNKFI